MAALLVSFGITILLTNAFFLANSPLLNKKLIISFFKTRNIPTPSPKTKQNTVGPTQKSSLTISASPSRRLSPANPPTGRLTPTIKPAATKTPTLAPTKSSFSPTDGTCPTTSNQTYSSRRQNPSNPNRLSFDPAQNPETNLNLRGWYEVNEARELISRNGNNYGLDPNMPPQISTLFTNHFPKIIKTYRINAWDYDNHHTIPGESATPAYAVHMLGLGATPGEPLVGLKAGYFLVRYATKNYILMTNGDEDSWDADDDGGYPFYFLDICVDPNLLAAYESDNAAGRNQLPQISTGQVFGYAMTNEVKFVIRDTFSFMDARYTEDWWTYGQ